MRSGSAVFVAPSWQDWLQENHLARFIAGLMPGLDLFNLRSMAITGGAMGVGKRRITR